jgi:hypothetical protein
MFLWIFFYLIYREVRPRTPWSMVGDIHKCLWISSTAVVCRATALKNIACLSEFLSMDQVILNIKSLSILSDKRDLLVILVLVNLQKLSL